MTLFFFLQKKSMIQGIGFLLNLYINDPRLFDFFYTCICFIGFSHRFISGEFQVSWFSDLYNEWRNNIVKLASAGFTIVAWS